MELEYKWRITAPRDFKKFDGVLRGLGFKKNAARLLITDTYFDDRAGALRAQKIALRLRRVNCGYQITLKNASEIKNGLARRRENTLALNAQTSAGARACLRGLFSGLWPHLGAPQKLFTIKNKRKIILLENKILKAELALDNCDIITPRKKIKFYEAELELISGRRAAFDALAKELGVKTGLAPAVKSKVATAAEYL
ncbi:MAG: CYTH domain-containing protein [Elusimicrobiota bacterium]|jgi:inorganic triphosphatase YgiF|nr:CYTH domain-containing protein [Elusimicrobiota bacterium]